MDGLVDARVVNARMSEGMGCTRSGRAFNSAAI